MKYKENVWYGWNGGECPVHPETVVQYVLDNSSGPHTEIAECANWTWDLDHMAKVVAFRVIKEHKEPREFWCVMSHMFGSEDKAKTFLDDLNGEHPGMNFGQVYKVREVLE